MGAVERGGIYSFPAGSVFERHIGRSSAGVSAVRSLSGLSWSILLFFFVPCSLGSKKDLAFHAMLRYLYR